MFKGVMGSPAECQSLGSQCVGPLMMVLKAGSGTRWAMRDDHIDHGLIWIAMALSGSRKGSLTCVEV